MGGCGLGLECSHRWGAPEISKGREQKRRPSPTCGPSIHWGSPGTGASPGPKSLGACCGFLSLVNIFPQPRGSLPVPWGAGQAGLGGAGP